MFLLSKRGYFQVPAVSFRGWFVVACDFWIFVVDSRVCFMLCQLSQFHSGPERHERTAVSAAVASENSGWQPSSKWCKI